MLFRQELITAILLNERQLLTNTKAKFEVEKSFQLCMLLPLKTRPLELLG